MFRDFTKNKTQSAVCCLVAAFLLFCGCHQSDGIQTFQEAQNVFDVAENAPPEEQPEKFRHAVALYENLVNKGVKSGAIFYNLGNAYAGAEEPAKALACYHLALRYRPLDTHITENIQSVLNGAVPAVPETPLAEQLLFWQNWTGVQTKVYGSFLFAVPAFISGILFVFYPKRQLRYAALVCLTVCSIFSLSASYDWYRFERTKYAIVAVEQGFPRKGNSENYETAFTAAVPFGSTATVLYERNHWVFLRFGADRRGWLPKEQVVIF